MHSLQPAPVHGTNVKGPVPVASRHGPRVGHVRAARGADRAYVRNRGGVARRENAPATQQIGRKDEFQCDKHKDPEKRGRPPRNPLAVVARTFSFNTPRGTARPSCFVGVPEGRDTRKSTRYCLYLLHIFANLVCQTSQTICALTSGSPTLNASPTPCVAGRPADHPLALPLARHDQRSQAGQS